MIGNRLMLGLKDSNNDSLCEYEQRSIMPKQKKKKAKSMSKRKFEMPLPKPLEYQHPQNTMLHCQDQSARKTEDDTLDLYSSSEQHQDHSKPFMGSIGSWINDLFNVPNKRPNLPDKDKTKPIESESIDENSEYFKSINAIKEQFKKKLKSETSVHISTGDKLLDLNFISAHEIKKTKSLPSCKTFDILQDLNDLCNLPQTEVKTLEIKSDLYEDDDCLSLFPTKSSGKEVLLHPIKRKNDTVLTNLSKEKKKQAQKNRMQYADLQEYLLPNQADLTNKLLLNINDTEKCSQSYKNTHLSMQESQRYGQRKNKSYQSNTRCYTTNANLIENSNSKSYLTVNNKSRGFHFLPSDSADNEENTKKRLDSRSKHSRGRMSRKTFSEFFRESSTFVKVNTAKSLVGSHIEPSKKEPKSDELVKYLMKRIKVTHRPQTPKKKTSTTMPMVTAGKNRFMQSATNSLVVSVMAKRENDGQMMAKSGPKNLFDNKLMKSELASKPSFPAKEWPLKYNENNMRFDIKRAVGQQKFNKNSYLLEDFKGDGDYLIDKNSYKSTKRYNDPLKRDMKEYSEKHNKRQEVKNMLSKLDVKGNLFHMSKVKQKEQKKKVENLKPPKIGEAHLARFQKQHEVFKSNIRANQDAEDCPEDMEEAQADPVPTSLSTELAVLNTSLQMVPDKEEYVEPDSKIPATTEVPEIKMLECFNIDGKSPKGKHHETQPAYKDKLIKTKSLQYIKEGDSKNLLNSLTEYCNDELQNKKDSPQIYEPPICSPELRAVKPLDTVLLNRKYSTNPVLENACEVLCLSPENTDEPIKESEKGKKNGENKGKDDKKPCKISGAEEIATDTEKAKNTGPNCDKEKSGS